MDKKSVMMLVLLLTACHSHSPQQKAIKPARKCVINVPYNGPPPPDGEWSEINKRRHRVIDC